MGSLLKILMVLLVVQTASGEMTNGLYAAFDTSMGSFTCRLDYAEAPLTCANFAGLAEGSQVWASPEGVVNADPFYDGLIFHRVITNFMIQGGCPLGTGTSGPGYAFPDEFSTNLTHHGAGILSMANSGPHSGGSQFFITLKNTDWLDEKHAVFGEVVDGMDVVYDIGNVAVTNGSVPLTNVVMNTVRILRIGSAAEAFDPADQPLPEVSPLNLSITNTLSGVEVIAATSNQCEQTLYASTNLQDWAASARYYSFQSEGDRAIPVFPALSEEFFRGVRVFYPQAISGLSADVTGHQLEFLQGTDRIVFNPQAEGSGSCVIAGTPDEIISWEWSANIWSAFIQVRTALGYNLVFEIKHDDPGNGNWNGYYYNAGWNYMGEWSFINTPPVP